MSFIFTPLTSSKQITAKDSADRWLSLNAFLQPLTDSLVTTISVEPLPDELGVFFQYITHHASPIPESFLLPLEARYLKFESDKSRTRLFDHPRDAFLLLGAYLVSKVLVQKILFKP
jgi:hypothetical protein